MLEKGYYDKADTIIKSHGAMEASLIPIIQDGTACHVRKSTTILERIYSELGLSKDKVTTEDMLFTVETVSCLGACGLAPVLTVNDKVYPSMTPDDAAQLLQKLREEE